MFSECLAIYHLLDIIPDHEGCINLSTSSPNKCWYDDPDDPISHLTNTALTTYCEVVALVSFTDLLLSY
jgi:hypothetical protein